jgi:glycosyltransferase involved in cell wall biosynthesis
MDKAVVLTSYYRPKPGGYCKRYFRAINALLSQGAEVHYLAVEKFPIDHAQCFYHKFPWPKGHTDKLIFWMCFYIISPFYLLYLGIKYNITHSFVFGPTYSFVLQPLRILKRIPLSLFLRADTILNHRISGRAEWIVKLDQLFEGAAVQGVRIYGVSDALTNTVLSRHWLFKPAKHSTLRNNIKEQVLDVTSSNNFPPVLGCVGVLEKRKNQQILLQSISKIPKGSVKLNVYGTGPDEKALKELTKVLKITDQVTFKGWVDADLIWSEIDILAMPSLHEGAPNAVLEALSHGIPVLASDIAEHAEILPAESLVPVNSAGDWSQKIMDISDNKVLLNEIRNGQKQYSKKLLFDWEKQITGLILEG